MGTFHLNPGMWEQQILLLFIMGVVPHFHNSLVQTVTGCPCPRLAIGKILGKCPFHMQNSPTISPHTLGIKSTGLSMVHKAPRGLAHGRLSPPFATHSQLAPLQPQWPTAPQMSQVSSLSGSAFYPEHSSQLSTFLHPSPTSTDSIFTSSLYLSWLPISSTSPRLAFSFKALSLTYNPSVWWFDSLPISSH